MKKSKIINSMTLTIALLVGSNHGYAESLADEIKAIENGLIGSVRLVDDPRWTIDERMEHYGVPGVSIAVIKDFKIHFVKHYGVTDKDTNQAVSDNTLFQAGSISKPVAAYGALKLVEQGVLSLDEPVNQKLKSWKIPQNEFTKTQSVALKHLMNHSAGLTVHGFLGYAEGLEVPSVTQVLNGVPPANSAAVVVDLVPETKMQYSGGGYTVMQKLVTDVKDGDYPQIMNRLVIEPIGMSRSTYEQPLPPEKLKHAAAGYLPNKQPVVGKRHVYPEMAAAGLWTTAEDLAKFAIDVQLAIKSDQSKVLSQKMANKMLTPFVAPNVGLGFFLQSKKGDSYFAHGGWDEGFSANLIAHKTKGYGVVVMTNSNHPSFISELENSVATTYGWDNYLGEEYTAEKIAPAEKERITGRYKYSPDWSFSIFTENDRVFMQYLGEEPMESFKIGDNQYIRRERAMKFSFQQDKETGMVNLVWDLGNGETETRFRLKAGEHVPFEYVVTNQLEKAEKAYETFLETNPEQAQQSQYHILQIALDKQRQGKAKEALALLKFTTRIFPKIESSWQELANAYQLLGDETKELKTLQLALKAQPDNQRFLKRIKDLEG